MNVKTKKQVSVKNQVINLLSKEEINKKIEVIKMERTGNKCKIYQK